eukprot:Gb_14503 [translate_table: standard]
MQNSQTMSNIAACGIIISPPLFAHFGWNGLRVKRDASMKLAGWRGNNPNLMISYTAKPYKFLQIRAAAGTTSVNASSPLEVLKKVDLGAMTHESKNAWHGHLSLFYYYVVSTTDRNRKCRVWTS